MHVCKHKSIQVASTQVRPGNNSQLSGIPGFDSKIFCESAVLTTLETASNMHKNADSMRQSDSDTIEKCYLHRKMAINIV